MKWYNVKLSNVILIGEFPYFEDTDKVEICDMGFGSYRGIEVKKRAFSSVRTGEVYKTKSEALEVAKRNYASNLAFADGTIPFELVFFLRGIGWQVFSSNTINNEMLVIKRLSNCCQ